MLDQNLVVEAVRFLGNAGRASAQALGHSHVIVAEFLWRTAQATYKLHFLGGNNHRGQLIASIEAHIEVLGRATNALGVTHPTTLEMCASLQLCFEEQLDWTLDDIPREHIDALDDIKRPPGHNVFWK